MRITLYRRSLLGLAFLLALASTLTAQEAIDPALATADPEQPVLWYDLQHLDVEGQGWTDLESDYDRLPARAKQIVRPEVWNLSHHSAGLCVRFVTDATAIHARWTLTSSRLELPHMPSTGVSGVDLYVRHEGRWRWLANGRPKDRENNTAQLAFGIPEGQREYMLYLPLYNGVKSVEIGIPKGRTLAKAPPRPADRIRPLVFYGTSITQGGCASRPGMAHTAIIGRRFERPVINLGFSGNGILEPEIAELMAELDAAVYIVDCLPNSTASQIAQRTAPLVRILRDKHSQTPILLVEDRTYGGSFLIPRRRQNSETKRAALRHAFEQLQAEGVPNLYYLEGEKLLNEDGEGTVDGSHPTDLGFTQQAHAFIQALEPILNPAP